MSLEVTGRLHAKFPTQQIKDNFSKREFVLELTDESPTGMVFTNYASFQLVNQSCAVVDQFQEGEVLKVTFNIRGNRWERDGQVKYITNLNAWRVERAAMPAAPGAPQPQQQFAQPQQPQQFQQQQQNNNFGNTSNQPDDLPF
jgi:single-stranded DNA-binding protein